ncbi:MAG: response regulator, partial [Phycisphaerales bacterium]|nr:response regulator [Phycisphaerales bacterium]
VCDVLSGRIPHEWLLHFAVEAIPMSVDPMRPSEDHAPSILIVDDDEIFRERLARAFRDRSFDVRTAGNADEAIALARADSPEFAVLDLRMPGRSGLELVRDLIEIDATTRILMLTGYGSIANAVDAVRLGAVNYVSKPADADDIIAAFERHTKPVLVPTTTEYQAPSLARTEWEHINRVLSDCGGNISEAARRLDIHRRTLQRKLQKHPPAT